MGGRPEAAGMKEKADVLAPENMAAKVADRAEADKLAEGKGAEDRAAVAEDMGMAAVETVLADMAGKVEMVAGASREETAVAADQAEMAAGADMAEMEERADTEGMVDRAVEQVVWAVPGRGGMAGGMGDMNLVSEDLDDPTSNCRREAGTAAGRNNSSRLYYDIRSSNSRAWESTVPDGTRDRRHFSRNIHWALAWNRILSSKALHIRP